MEQVTSRTPPCDKGDSSPVEPEDPRPESTKAATTQRRPSDSGCLHALVLTAGQHPLVQSTSQLPGGYPPGAARYHEEPRGTPGSGEHQTRRGR